MSSRANCQNALGHDKAIIIENMLPELPKFGAPTPAAAAAQPDTETDNLQNCITFRIRDRAKAQEIFKRAPSTV